MPFLPSLPAITHLSDLFARFPRGTEHLMAYTDVVLRADGALSIGERELIATYVSGLNACTFCYGSHKIYAEVFGIDGDTIDALIADVDTSPIDEKLKPVMRYVRKLNTLPSKMVDADAQAVFDAGWPEEALFEAVQVSALFNMMNRIIEGTGINFDYAINPGRHQAKGSTPEMQQHSYRRFSDTISKD
ncbi:MAG: peroxidase-related enzyme [Rhodobacteraceae bacterium]|nr:peroxidase-related enzyme [Paracoccaceae bacterium]